MAVYESIGKRAVLVIPGIWRCWVAQVVAWRPEIEVVARAKPRRVGPRIVRAHRLPAVILERFVFVPECRGDRHAARTRDRVLPPREREITFRASAPPLSAEIDARATPTPCNHPRGSRRDSVGVCFAFLETFRRSRCKRIGKDSICFSFKGKKGSFLFFFSLFFSSGKCFESWKRLVEFWNNCKVAKIENWKKYRKRNEFLYSG